MIDFTLLLWTHQHTLEGSPGHHCHHVFIIIIISNLFCHFARFYHQVLEQQQARAWHDGQLWSVWHCPSCLRSDCWRGRVREKKGEETGGGQIPGKLLHCGMLERDGTGSGWWMWEKKWELWGLPCVQKYLERIRSLPRERRNRMFVKPLATQCVLNLTVISTHCCFS